MWGALLDTSMEIQRQTVGVDGSGGVNHTWATVSGGSDILCSVQPLSAYAIDLYMRREISVNTMIYCTANLDAILPTGTNPDGTTFSGPKLGDRFALNGAGVTTGPFWVIRGVSRQSNAVLSPEPLYEIVAERRIV